MSQFRPMLASTLDDVTALSFPVLASPKLDGIRCVIRGGKALSRSLKPIPNEAVRAFLERRPELEGCDGELMVQNATFQAVTSAFMSRKNELPAGWYFAVFDHVSERTEALPYRERAEAAAASVRIAATTHVQLVPQTSVSSLEELDAYEATVLSHGYEGVMLRRGNAHYKRGRSAGDGALRKLKRFLDSEAEVIGFTELQHNANAAIVSELGLTKRSSAKSGKTGAGMLGALVVRDLSTGVEFEIGTGFTEAQRLEFFDLCQRGQMHRRIAKYKHFPTGVKDKPRFPVFLGWRAPEDMSPPDPSSPPSNRSSASGRGSSPGAAPAATARKPRAGVASVAPPITRGHLRLVR